MPYLFFSSTPLNKLFSTPHSFCELLEAKFLLKSNTHKTLLSLDSIIQNLYFRPLKSIRMIIIMNTEFLAFYFLLAFTGQFISWKFPFREQTENKEKLWDCLAILSGRVFAIGYIALIGAPAFLLLTHETALVQWREIVESWNPIYAGIAQFLLIDFLLYWAHRSMHHQRLWNVHAFHHSPKHLWWGAGLRASPIHMLMNSIPYTLAAVMFPTPEGALITAIALFLDIANQHWIHSNIKVPFSKYIEWIFVTPRLHFVHHSKKREFSDSNYGFVFSFWDRFFGTLTNPEKVSDNEVIGLNYNNTNARLFWGVGPKVKLKAPQAEQAME